LPKFLRQSYRRTKWGRFGQDLKKFRKNFLIFRGKFLKQNHRPAKFSYSFFLKVAQKFGRIENFVPPKGQGSRMPLVRVVYHDLLRGVAARSNHGRKDEGQGVQFHGRRKVLTMSHELQCSTFASERPQVRIYRCQTCFLPRAPSNFVASCAGLTIVANVAIATGPALLGAPRSSAIYLLYYIMYQILFGPISQYFATAGICGKQGFSIERCLCPDILV